MRLHLQSDNNDRMDNEQDWLIGSKDYMHNNNNYYSNTMTCVALQYSTVQ